MTTIKKKFYITTPIYYPNGEPHLGHLHTTFLADFFTRTLKLFNYDVYFSTGTDEHGQKIENKAKSLGISPKTLVDQQSNVFKNMMEKFYIKYDRFIRTTDEDHEKNILLVWNKLIENKYLYRGTYVGLYSEKDECFYSEDETIINGEGIKVAISSGNTVVEMKEECWFFALSNFKEKLLKLYEKNNITIPSNAKMELISYVKNLKDLCVSRKISWGIKIPNSDETIYVWIDALFNYISSIGNIHDYNKDLWNNTLHIMAKDIIIFHGVFWPALLMAVDIEPSIKLFVHGWWLIDNNKMSKSIGNVINPLDLPIKPDYLRYCCLRWELLGHDGQFSMNQVSSLINNELIDKFCNLIFRLFSLIEKKIGLNKEIYIIPKKDIIEEMEKKLEEALLNFSSKKYIEIIIENATLCNQYIELNKLWNNMTDEHLNYLIPMVHKLIYYSGGFMTTFPVPNYYDYLKKDNEKFIFILKKLEGFFQKVLF